MEQTAFGNTGISVGRTGFGCIPIQRVSYDESTALLRHAYKNGITLYDTANAYTTSEERIGIALGAVRDKIILCTKSFPLSPEKVIENLENSLRMLKTDYIDVFQIHNPSFVPRPGGEDGLYDCMLKAKEQGKIKHIGITYHSRDLAREAVLSGLYEVLQFPFSYLSSEEELALIGLCREQGMGVLAMKGLCGGMLTNAKAAFAFLRQYDNVVPIWGIQKMSELDEFLAYEKAPPVLDGGLLREMEADKAALSGSFCRACGYCLPCPADIPINFAARMTFLLERMPREDFLGAGWQEKMRRISGCANCGLCKSKCPYKLDAPELLKQQQAAYFEILKAEGLS